MANRLLVVFLTVGFLFLFFFGYPVVFQIYKNAAYTAEIKPTSIQWSTQAITDEEWRPLAKFDYVVDGKTYEKTEIFQGESYRNPFALEEALKTLDAKYPVVWYSEKEPSNATLEKYFPMKRAIYSGILLALLTYFIFGLQWYIAKGKR